MATKKPEKEKESERVHPTPKVAKNQGEQGTVYSLVDVPPLSFWQTSYRRLGLRGTTPHTPHVFCEAAKAYCDGETVRDKLLHGKLSPSSKVDQARDTNTLPSEKGVDAYTLHWMGLQLQSHRPLNPKFYSLAINMLSTAQDMGHGPSSLQLVITSVHTPQDLECFRLARFRHTALCSTGTDASALALRAWLWEQQGFHDRARDEFIRARGVGMRYRDPDIPDMPLFTSPGSFGAEGEGSRPRRERWFLEGVCHHSYATKALKAGEVDKAVEAFRIMALELDLAIGYQHLASLLPASEKAEREAYFLKAAVSGQEAACTQLALIEHGKVTRSSLDEEEMRTRLLMADEWARLGGVVPTVKKHAG